MNRREFAYLTAFAGLLSDKAEAARNRAEISRIPSAAGLITEMIFVDDCVRLAMYDPGISKAAKTALTSFPDYVRNGSLCPESLAPHSAETYALAAGRKCSEALNRYRQPNSPEARLYQDIGIMRDVSATGGCNPGKPGPVEDLLNVLHVRRRLGLHTLNPDDDIHHWLEGIIGWWREQRDFRSDLASAYTSPDTTKMREFVAEFYNPGEALIRLARNFQFGEVAPADAFTPAFDRAREGTGYARGLRTALEDLRKLPQP